jgi:aspartate aminotransferase-like enzyme
LKPLNMPFVRPRLLCPGPTQTPQFIDEAGRRQIYHRTDEFRQLFCDLRQGLQRVLFAEELPVVLTSSGTGAMEAAIVNFIAPGTEVIVVDAGKFGERWAKIAKCYSLVVHVVHVPWGQAVTLGQLEEAVRAHPKARALLMQSGETSTGVYHDIATLIPGLKKKWQGIVIVDAISTLLAHELRQTECQLDVVIGASQKAFSCHTGLSWVSAASSLWQQASRPERPVFYFDLPREFEAQKEGRPSFTPGSSLVLEMLAALSHIRETGTDQMIRHHGALSRGVRQAFMAMGMEVLPATNPHHGLTVVKLPPEIPGGAFIKQLRQQYQLTVAGGQDAYKDKVFRFGHLGFNDPFDIVSGLQSCGLLLKTMGRSDLSLGSSVDAFWAQYAQA